MNMPRDEWVKKVKAVERNWEAGLLTDQERDFRLMELKIDPTVDVTRQLEGRKEESEQ